MDTCLALTVDAADVAAFRRLPLLEQCGAGRPPTRQRRAAWRLKLPSGDEVDVVLDLGAKAAASAGAAREHRAVVRLALRSGSAFALFDCALDLLDAFPFRVCKLNRLADEDLPCEGSMQLPVKAAKAQPVLLRPEMAFAQALPVILGNCLQQIQDNEAGVVHQADVQCIRQMRIGVRRMRTALRLSARARLLPWPAQRELRWLGGELGAARDAELLADSAQATIEDIGTEPAEMATLVRLASEMSASKREQATRAVASPRYSRLLVMLAGCVHLAGRTLPPATGAAGAAPSLRTCAADILARHRDSIRAKGKRLSKAGPERRHRLRIAVKEARYVAEFFQSLPSGRQSRRLIKRLAALQTLLGRLNDGAVVDGWLRKIATAQPTLARSTSRVRKNLRKPTRRASKQVMRKYWALMAIDGS